MAKSPKPENGNAASFTFDDLPLPARAVGGRGSGAASETMQKLAAVPVDRSFLEPVTVPDTITDPAERTKAFKEEAKKATNRISGAIRRFRKSHGERNFAIRTVNDDTAGRGVRIWRTADSI